MQSLFLSEIRKEKLSFKELEESDKKKINKFIFLSILLIPSNVQVFLTPQRNLNHLGKEKTYIKKVKIVEAGN